MEQSMSLLTFKGSISEAVFEAKKQRKLFLVYVSEEDGASMLSEHTTSMDLNVADTISKNCIFLHLVQGSNDAANFSAIYPQKSVPCITIIGHNGVMLWQHEGCISSDNLISSIKQALVTLHIQETTATFLTAALASKKTESASPSSSNAVMFGQGSSSSVDVPNSLKDKPLQESDDQALVVSELSEDNRDRQATTESEEASTPSIHVSELKPVKDEQSASPSEPSENLPSTVTKNLDSSEVQFGTSDVGGVCTNAEDNTSSISEVLESVPASLEIAKDMESNVQDKKADAVDNHMDARKSNDVYLNIRLPDGGSLQKKFCVTDTLRLVKGYVDENQSGIGLYDLAVPYPRKVFKEQDLSKELSELGLFNRQALVVVPHHPGSGFNRGQPLSSNNTTSASHTSPSSDSQAGYFGRLKSILSYMNPFSYLGNASSAGSEQEANNGVWQYSPNRNLQNQFPETERPYRLYSPNSSNVTTSSTGGNATSSNSRKPPKTSGFGSNIHTLKHDDDDDGPSKDRNTFWNGNSTQYGGNNNDDSK